MANDFTEAIVQQPNYLNILDTIYELESSAGTNKAAYKENTQGALGGYQLKRGAIKDIQRVFPSKWKGKSFTDITMKDDVAREAASDYLKVISMHLINKGMTPTMDALLASYHSGMGTVGKGRGLGEEGIEYLEKAKRLREVAYGNDER